MLIELPNGQFVSPSVVVAVRPVQGLDGTARVFLDLSSASCSVMIEFASTTAAGLWAKEFASQVNAAGQPALDT